jgi:hypothetical protein
VTIHAQSIPTPAADARAAFAELGRLSFEDTSMHALLQRVVELSQQVVPGVAEASVTVVLKDKASTAASTGELALALDQAQYARGDGPCLEAAVGQEIREISDMRQETRWPDYAREGAERGALSSLSMPVPVSENMQAALNVFALMPGAFDDASRTTSGEFAPTSPSRSATSTCTRPPASGRRTWTPRCAAGRSSSRPRAS